MAAPAADGFQSNAPGAPPLSTADPPPRRRLLTPVSAVTTAVTLIALGLRAYVLFRPGLTAVTQYDDGPYLGSAVRLVHGVLPYRGFAFVQPPGITLLMSPAAALSYLTGTSSALIAGRMLTVLAGAASALLGCLLVRHRGLVAVTVTGGILAIYPPAVAAAHTVLLEPWLVLACLGGAVAVFDGDRPAASARRLLWGGAVFGFAGTIKAWAIVPALILLVLCLRDRRRAGGFAAGVAIGFAVPVLPFFLAAPSKFYDSVVVAQLARIGYRVSPWSRLHDLFGLLPDVKWPHSALAWTLTGVLVLAVAGQAAASVLLRRAPPALDWFALLSAAGVFGIFLWPPYFTAHYAAFLAPFLALALALPVSRLAAGTRARLAGHRARSPAGRRPAEQPLAGQPPAGQRAASGLAGRVLGSVATCLAVAGLVVASVLQALPEAESRFPPAPASVISDVIPAGACVLTDQSSYLLLADRFLARSRSCPQMVDSLGTDLALSGGRRPSTGTAEVPAVRAFWRGAFHRAQYVLLTTRNELRIPWTPPLADYFHRSFRAILWTRNFTIYARHPARIQ
jgi:hypothetical protein